MCTTNLETKKLYLEIAEEVMDVFTRFDYFSIGVDETWNAEKCKRCKQVAVEKGMDRTRSTEKNVDFAWNF